MHFLKSILFLRTENQELRHKLKQLETEIQLLKTAQTDLAKCTQQMALSLSDVAKELSSIIVYVYELESLSNNFSINEELNSTQDRKMFN
jgi:hypothetical protein